MQSLNNLLPLDASIEQALRIIDANAGKIALVVDENRRLLGTVSDGDARRAFLRGLTLSSPVAEIMNRSPLTVSPETDRQEILRLMQERVLRHVPVVDHDGCVVGLRALEALVAPEPRENWVVILAGGEGRRLRPLTDTCPKPMLPLGEKPLLERTILNLKAAGFSHFYLAVNYMADTIIAHFGDGSAFGVEIRYLQEDLPLGTAGPLGLLPETPKAPIIVMNGDILTQVHFESMLDFHDEHNSIATMGVREHEVMVPYGVINVDEISITDIEEKPIQRYLISAGIYVLSPETARMVRPHVRLDMPDLFREVRRQSPRVVAYLIREYWIDIGHMDDLSRARHDYLHMFSET